jgi:hypothetical protein
VDEDFAGVETHDFVRGDTTVGASDISADLSVDVPLHFPP